LQEQKIVFDKDTNKLIREDSFYYCHFYRIQFQYQLTINISVMVLQSYERCWLPNIAVLMLRGLLSSGVWQNVDWKVCTKGMEKPAVSVFIQINLP